MPDTLQPQFPPFPKNPEEVQSASKQALNIWVGAMSPMWVPFWAATSFGLGAWAIGQSLTRTDDMIKGMPLNSKWPSLWRFQATAAQAIDKAVEEAIEHALPVVEAATSAVAEEVETLIAAADNLSNHAAPPTVEIAIDPVIEAPVEITKSVEEAVTDVTDKTYKAIKTAAKTKVEPKAIAKTMAVKTPKAED